MKLFSSAGMDLHLNNAIKYLGFEPYDPIEDIEKPAMFWLYFQEDYEYLLNHKGGKYVYWHNSDVLRLKHIQDFWQYIPQLRHGITHACHNSLLQEELAQNFGIYSIVRPVFWNDVTKYPESYEYSDKPEVYITSHPNRDVEYGEPYMHALSELFPNLIFHIYGNEGESTDNLFYHGAVSEETMDLEIKDMQICLRMNKHDGFAQTSMKSILMGQYLITGLEYPQIPYAKDFSSLVGFIMKIINRKLSTVDYHPTRWKESLNNFDWINK